MVLLFPRKIQQANLQQLSFMLADDKTYDRALAELKQRYLPPKQKKARVIPFPVARKERQR